MRIPGTKKLSQPKYGDDDEKDNNDDDDDDDGMTLGAMDMPQVSGGTACKELWGDNRNNHTSDTPEQRTYREAVMVECMCVCVCVYVCMYVCVYGIFRAHWDSDPGHSAG